MLTLGSARKCIPAELGIKGEQEQVTHQTTSSSSKTDEADWSEPPVDQLHTYKSPPGFEELYEFVISQE